MRLSSKAQEKNNNIKFMCFKIFILKPSYSNVIYTNIITLQLDTKLKQYLENF